MLNERFRELAAGIGFTEGPVWTGDRLLVTSISRGHLYEIPLDSAAPTLVCETGGGPNGAALAPDGSVWVTQNGGHVITELPEPVTAPGLQRWADGSVAYVVDSGLRAPNDLAFDSAGDVWFTDPHERLSREAPETGRVWKYRVAADELELVMESLGHPNGIAFSPDGATLYVTESIARRVVRLPIADGSVVADPQEVIRFDGEPDGMAIDLNGDLYVAVHHQDNAIIHCDADGRHIARIAAEDLFPTNVCFAGEDLSVLVVTSPRGGRVLAVDLPTSGHVLPGQQRTRS